MALKPYPVSSQMKAIIVNESQETADAIEELENAKECLHVQAAQDQFGVVWCPDCAFSWMSWELI